MLVLRQFKVWLVKASDLKIIVTKLDILLLLVSGLNKFMFRTIRDSKLLYVKYCKLKMV